jgi:hypothetical protein
MGELGEEPGGDSSREFECAGVLGWLKAFAALARGRSRTREP